MKFLWPLVLTSLAIQTCTGQMLFPERIRARWHLKPDTLRMPERFEALCVIWGCYVMYICYA